MCHFRLGSDAHSFISSSASEATKKSPFLYQLYKVNRVLEELQVPKLTETTAKNPKYVNLKIDELGKAIRLSLGVNEPEICAGEKVMDQFVSEFDKVSTANQYRIMTSMPKDVNRELLQQTFWVTEHKARRAKEIQGEHGLLSTSTQIQGKGYLKVWIS